MLIFLLGGKVQALRWISAVVFSQIVRVVLRIVVIVQTTTSMLQRGDRGSSGRAASGEKKAKPLKTELTMMEVKASIRNYLYQIAVGGNKYFEFSATVE
jgi:hypothetical protein